MSKTQKIKFSVVKYLYKMAKIYIRCHGNHFVLRGSESYIPCIPDKTHHISKFGENRRDVMPNPLRWLCRETLKKVQTCF